MLFPNFVGTHLVRHRTFLAGLVSLLLLATFLRFHRLGGQSFWNDEGNSARLSERSIGLIIEGTASDIHPPLYYLLLRGWRELVGETEFGLRSLSAFAGVGVVAVTMALGWVLFGRGVALLAGMVAAVNPALVYYSQEARMYELLALLAGLATLWLVGWLERGTQGNSGELGGTQERIFSRTEKNTDRKNGYWVVAYVVTVAAGLYTHYFFPAVLVGHGVMVGVALVSQRQGDKGTRKQGDKSQIQNPKSKIPNPKSKILAWVGMMGVVGVLYLPWLPVFVRQAGGREAVRGSLLGFVGESGRWLVLGGMVERGEAFWGMVGVVGLLVWGVLRIAYCVLRIEEGSEYGIRNTLYIWLLLVVPVGLMWLGGLVQEAFFKFMVVGVGPLALLMGWGGASVWGGKDPVGLRDLRGRGRGYLGRVVGLVLLGLVLWGSGRGLVNLYGDPAYGRADYRGMAARIKAEGHPNAGIILDAANQWEVFTYYHQEGAPVYPIPRGRPEAGAIAAELAEIAGRHERLYAIFWGEAQRDPERLVERWLDAHAFKAREEWVGDVRFVTYAVPAEAATTMEQPVNLAFGEDITLLGYTLGEEEVAAGDIIELTLFWEAVRPIDERYKVFLHLVDEEGGIVAQRDSEPGGGLALTTTWRPGETVVDNHGVLVPLEVPAGRYRLVLGLYEVLGEGARLPIGTADGGVVDAWEVGVIRVD